MKMENNNTSEGGVDVSSETLVGGNNNNINSKFAATGKSTSNYDDDFVEVTGTSNNVSPVKNDLGRTTSSLEDVSSSSLYFHALLLFLLMNILCVGVCDGGI